MKKSILLLALLLGLVACAGNTNENKSHSERIDELTANAKEGFNRGADKVGEIAKEVDKSITKGVNEVSQRAKASMERHDVIFDRAKVEVKDAAEAVKERGAEFGTELIIKSADACEKALEESSEAIKRVRESVKE